MELDSNGKIKTRTPCCRSVGTTVTLSQLFVTLPVRRRDFTRNIKKEFTKMCHILQAYCLVSKKVRIICSNHTAKTGKTVVLQTHGVDDMLANITAIFGARQSAELLPFKPAFSEANNEVDADNENITEDASEDISNEDLARLKAGYFLIEGFISSCSHGAGRSSKDRQYFFVNSRPCEPKNIAKVVNDIYHRYNAQQQPFVCLNIVTARADVDVNLTPDKRQLLIHNEKLLLFLIKRSLVNTFGSIPAQYKMQNTSIATVFKVEPKSLPTVAADDSDNETANSLAKNSSKLETSSTDGADELVPISSTQKFLDVLTQWRRTGDTVGAAPVSRVTNPAKRKCDNEIEVRTLKMKKIQSYLSQELPASGNSKDGNQTFSYKSDTESENEEANASFPNIEQLNKASKLYDEMVQSRTVERIDCKVAGPAKSFLTFLNVKPLKSENTRDDQLTSTQETNTSDTSNETELMSLTNTSQQDADMQAASSQNMQTVQLDDDCVQTDSMDLSIENYNCTVLSTSIAEIATQLKAEESYVEEQRSAANFQRLRFKSEISPTENKNAETELQTEIAKSDFAHQHATDEKYNFEMLQQTTTLQSQPLAVPQPLELTVVNEMVLKDNLNVFEKNGFKFEIDDNAPPMRKVRLLCKPFSKNWEFGKEDIDELIFMLQDAPEGTICRPSRIRAMFASRACRKSVMIGKPLKNESMKTLIRHMGEIEQPWNCPHGRPTCRHLINIAMLKGDDANVG